MVRFLIDGYNLMHAAGMVPTGRRSRFDAARKAFLNWLVESDAARRGAAVHVVFDAQEGRSNDGPQPYRGLWVCFAYKQTADDWIERALANEPTPRFLIVVSNDNRLKEAARRRRAESWECEEFTDWLRTGLSPPHKPIPAKRLQPDADDASEKPDGPPPPDEAAALMSAFQVVVPAFVKPLRPPGR